MDIDEIRKQATFFLKDKIKAARLAFTDVSELQLMTEEATNDEEWGPETRAMRAITDASERFEERTRIMQVLRQRLSLTGGKYWRQLYKTLVLVEYILTHGSERLAVDFKSDRDVLEELTRFKYVDDRGFDRGLTVRQKSLKILNLLNDAELLIAERSHAQKVSHEILGFGGFASGANAISSSQFCIEGFGNSTAAWEVSADEKRRDFDVKEKQSSELPIPWSTSTVDHQFSERGVPQILSHTKKPGSLSERHQFEEDNLRQGRSQLSVSNSISASLKWYNQETTETESPLRPILSPQQFPTDAATRWHPKEDFFGDPHLGPLHLKNTAAHNSMVASTDLFEHRGADTESPCARAKIDGDSVATLPSMDYFAKEDLLENPAYSLQATNTKNISQKLGLEKDKFRSLQKLEGTSSFPKNDGCMQEPRSSDWDAFIEERRKASMKSQSVSNPPQQSSVGSLVDLLGDDTSFLSTTKASVYDNLIGGKEPTHGQSYDALTARQDVTPHQSAKNVSKITLLAPPPRPPPQYEITKRVSNLPIVNLIDI